MSEKQRFLQESIRQIKEALDVDKPDYTAKDIYLKKGEDLIGLHTYGDLLESGEFQQMEAWCNAYDNNFKFLGSIYRIFGPIEDEAAELKKDGWLEIKKP